MAITYLKKSPKTSSTDDTKTTGIVQDLLKNIETTKEQGCIDLTKKFDKYDGEIIVSKERIEEIKKTLIAAAEEILEKIKSKAPLAIGMVVDCVNAVFLEENGYQTEANSFARCVKSGDYKEGTSAFLEKRKPVFRGE